VGWGGVWESVKVGGPSAPPVSVDAGGELSFAERDSGMYPPRGKKGGSALYYMGGVKKGDRPQL